MRNGSTSYPKVIAVDFDGCLCANKWPEIGEENRQAINELIRRKADGDKIILWTCRTDQQLDDAVLWCMNRGLKFDAINENLPDNKEKFGNDCRKVFAHEYWDDKAVFVSAQVHKNWIKAAVNRIKALCSRQRACGKVEE